MINAKTECPKGIPEHLWLGLKYYVLEGRPTGSFLEALFANDLFEVFGRGDGEAIGSLQTMVNYIYNKCPCQCYGSRERVKAWTGMKR